MQFYSHDTTTYQLPAEPRCFVPCIQPGYCETATFRFKLPACNPGQKPTEYVAFVVPQINTTDVSGNTSQCYCRSTAVQCDDFPASERCPVYPPPCPVQQRCTRWSTEYRSTIDDCARRILHSETTCKRDPIYPQNNYCWADFEDKGGQPAGLYAAPVPAARRDCDLRPVTTLRQKCVKLAATAPKRCQVVVKRQITCQSISPRRQPLKLTTSKRSQLRRPTTTSAAPKSTQTTTSAAPKSTQTTTKLMRDKFCETEEQKISDCAKPTGNRPMCRCKFPDAAADADAAVVEKSKLTVGGGRGGGGGMTETRVSNRPMRRCKLDKKDEYG